MVKKLLDRFISLVLRDRKHAQTCGQFFVSLVLPLVDVTRRNTLLDITSIGRKKNSVSRKAMNIRGPNWISEYKRSGKCGNKIPMFYLIYIKVYQL